MELDEWRVEYGNGPARFSKNYFAWPRFAGTGAPQALPARHEFAAISPARVHAAGTCTRIDQLSQMSYKSNRD
jgi:hypothetical protein